LIIWND